ncbi:hypothetical protein SANA_21360 [Gottschalkiaceae bacterium SANA]|nr:hypothetical protein SANA_21360 [Gottschalkiaceae bacterium SANA]
MRKGKFVSQLRFYFILLILIPILFVWVFVSMFLRADYLDDAVLENRIVMGNIETIIDETLINAETSLYLIGNLIIEEHADVDQILKVLDSHGDQFELVEVVDEKGILLNAYPSTNVLIGSDKSAECYYETFATGADTCWSSSFISPRSGNPVVTLARQIGDKTIVGYVNIDHIANVAENFSKNYNHEFHISIVGSHGEYISAKNREFVYQRRIINRFDEICSIYENDEPYGTLDHLGESTIANVTYIEKSGWYIIVFQPYTEIIREMTELNRVFLLTAITAILLGLFYAFRQVRKISREMNKISQETHTIAGGDFNHSIEIDTYSEFKQLMDDFEVMKGSIRSRNDQLHTLAYQDALTGLNNKAMIFEQINRWIADKGIKNFGLLFLDIRKFGNINDVYGHRNGDAALAKFADRLRQFEVDEGVIGRFWGDKFIILIPNFKGVDVLLERAERIHIAFEQPVAFNNIEIPMAFTIGMTQYPLDGEDLNTLIRNLDLVMHESEVIETGRTILFNEELSKKVRRRIAIENELAKAIDNQEFCLHLQPQIESKGKHIRGFEALLRWDNARLGKVGPSEFILIAEQSGLIKQIDEWVMEHAFAEIQKINKLFNKEFLISINVSAAQIQRIDFADKVIALMDKWKMKPQLVELEITELSILNIMDNVTQNINKLREQQVKIALDDFGTGYSSINHLSEIHVDTIKIDRSLMNNIDKSQRKWIIVKNLYNISKQLKYDVVLEGVETENQISFLKQLKEVYIQGYYYCKPQPIEELIAYIQKWQKEANEQA